MSCFCSGSPVFLMENIWPEKDVANGTPAVHYRSDRQRQCLGHKARRINNEFHGRTFLHKTAKLNTGAVHLNTGANSKIIGAAGWISCFSTVLNRAAHSLSNGIFKVAQLCFRDELIFCHFLADISLLLFMFLRRFSPSVGQVLCCIMRSDMR